jgi:serine/threonine protein kinase
MYIECMQHTSLIDYIVWKIQFQIALASTLTPRTCGYIAPKKLSTSKPSISKLRHVSPKSDVYSFGILLIQLVNGSFEDDFTFMVLSNGQKQFMYKKMDFKKFSML